MAFLIGGANSAADTGYDIDNSLRFNDDDDPSLLRTNDSGGSDTKATISFWMKRGHGAKMFYARSDNSNNAVITISGDPEYRLELRSYNGGSLDMVMKCSLSVQDASAWYHMVMVWDTTDGTTADRAKMYINGERVTDFYAYTTQFSSNDTIEWFQSDATFYISGEWEDGTIAGAWDGYIAEVYVIDGTAYQASTFGETDEDSGIWKPKKASVTYGTNGFKLEFKQTGTGTASASTIGADTSGNDNHLTSSGLAATDQSTDTPTNNFCTYNPLDIGSGSTFSEGNLATNTGDNKNDVGTMGFENGKWYWEVKAAGSAIVGVGHESIMYLNDTNENDDVGSVAFSTYHGTIFHNNNSDTTPPNDRDGQIIGCAVDMDNNKIYWHVDGTYIDTTGGTQNPATEANSITVATGTNTSGFWFPKLAAGTGSQTMETNFGNPSFSITSGNADDNGYGNFEFDVPAGYYALCTKNLAEFG